MRESIWPEFLRISPRPFEVVHDVELDVDHHSSWNVFSGDRYLLRSLALNDWNRCVETKGLLDAHRQVLQLRKVIPEVL